MKPKIFSSIYKEVLVHKTIRIYIQNNGTLAILKKLETSLQLRKKVIFNYFHIPLTTDLNSFLVLCFDTFYLSHSEDFIIIIRKFF